MNRGGRGERGVSLTKGSTEDHYSASHRALRGDASVKLTEQRDDEIIDVRAGGTGLQQRSRGFERRVRRVMPKRDGRVDSAVPDR